MNFSDSPSTPSVTQSMLCVFFQRHTNALSDLRCGAWELEGTGTSTDEGPRNTGEIRILHTDYQLY